MPVFVARYTFWRTFLLFLLSLGFVFLGAWIAGFVGTPPERGMEWAGWLSMIFFGLCAGAIFLRMFDRSDSLEISSLGITTRTWSDDMIPWSEITKVTIWKYKNSRSIVLHLRDPRRFPSPKILGKLAGANRLLTGGDITISLTGMDRSIDETLKAIARWIPDKMGV